jgi:cell division septal protein FtsQ
VKVVKKSARPRNQRVSNVRQRRQQHLLDVKVRSRSATQHRNRRVAVFVSKAALLIAVCLGIYIGGQLVAKRFFFDNPDYRLSTIDVQTDGPLQREQILHTADLHEGENVFRVNLSEVHDRLQQLPQVDEVQVVRKLPSEIDIKLIERKPIAWITSEKGMDNPFSPEAAFLVDARGILMKEKKLLSEYLGLPLITGCTSESLEAGKTVESYEAKAALELLRMSTRSFMQTRFQIREIDLSRGYCLSVTDKNRTRVAFAFENLDEQLQKLEQFLIYADDSKQELATVNLMVKRNIPVTFGPPPADVINETIDPNEEPRVMKAQPVGSPSKFGTFSAPAPRMNASAKKALSKMNRGKTHATESPAEVRRALPIDHGKKN